MDFFLRIGGVTISVNHRDPGLSSPLLPPLLRFRVDPSPADLQIVVERLDSYAPPTSPLLFDSGAVWKLYSEPEAYRIECQVDVLGEVPYKVADIEHDLRRATIRVRSRDGVPFNALEYPLDELLVNALVTRQGGIEFHSCGVVDHDGSGYLFVGNSGDGKTTTARLWMNEGAGILSDDRVIVREDDHAWWMYGTPWHGEADISTPERAPLRHIFVLEQATSNSVVSLSPAAAVARLFACGFPPFHDISGVSQLLDSLDRLTAGVPVSRLSFVKDQSAVAFVRDAAGVPT